MIDRVAKFVSLVTDPGIVFLVGIAILQFQVGPTEYLKGVAFTLISAIPIAFVAMRTYIRDRDEEVNFNQQERINIYLAAVFAFAFNSLLFGSQILQSNLWMNVAMIFTILAVLFYLTNYYFDKASIHVGMLAIWCMLLVEMVSINYALGLALLVPVTWSRLHLRKHTWPQIMWGLSLGLCVGVLAWVAL